MLLRGSLLRGLSFPKSQQNLPPAFQREFFYLLVLSSLLFLCTFITLQLLHHHSCLKISQNLPHSSKMTLGLMRSLWTESTRLMERLVSAKKQIKNFHDWDVNRPQNLENIVPAKIASPKLDASSCYWCNLANIVKMLPSSEQIRRLFFSIQEKNSGGGVSSRA